MSTASPKRALVTGITGQDGSYLAELLLEKSYRVWGMVRRASTFNTSRIDHLNPRSEDPEAPLQVIYGDLGDASSLNHVLDRVQPHEVYNLGAQSHVKASFDIPEYTAEVTGVGALRLLEALRESSPQTRIYQASSSEMFGQVVETPQTEKTPFRPRSPYAAAKVFAYHMTRNYREAYGLFAVNGILFNHESPRRGENFVTKKITRAVARIAAGLQDDLGLGNFDAKRDWGHARDYVEAMWLMLQADKPSDYVVATGETHSVREFCDRAFARAGLPLTWRGEGLDEQGLDADGRVLVRVDPRFFRPAEVDFLLGDAGKARRELGWEPRITFEQLVDGMLDADLAEVGVSSPAPV